MFTGFRCIDVYVKPKNGFKNKYWLSFYLNLNISNVLRWKRPEHKSALHILLGILVALCFPMSSNADRTFLLIELYEVRELFLRSCHSVGLPVMKGKALS